MPAEWSVSSHCHYLRFEFRFIRTFMRFSYSVLFRFLWNYVLISLEHNNDCTLPLSIHQSYPHTTTFHFWIPPSVLLEDPKYFPISPITSNLSYLLFLPILQLLLQVEPQWQNSYCSLLRWLALSPSFLLPLIYHPVMTRGTALSPPLHMHFDEVEIWKLSRLPLRQFSYYFFIDLPFIISIFLGSPPFTAAFLSSAFVFADRRVKWHEKMGPFVVLFYVHRTRRSRIAISFSVWP